MKAPIGLLFSKDAPVPGVTQVSGSPLRPLPKCHAPHKSAFSTSLQCAETASVRYHRTRYIHSQCLIDPGVTTMRRCSLTLLAAAVVALTASQAASAADLARRAPPPAPAYVPPPPPPFSWTGFYIGGNLGVAWTDGNVCCDDFGNSPSISQNAVFTGGGQVGANYQWGWLVLGGEGVFN